MYSPTIGHERLKKEIHTMVVMMKILVSKKFCRPTLLVIQTPNLSSSSSTLSLLSSSDLTREFEEDPSLFSIMMDAVTLSGGPTEHSKGGPTEHSKGGWLRRSQSWLRSSKKDSSSTCCCGLTSLFHI